MFHETENETAIDSKFVAWSRGDHKWRLQLQASAYVTLMTRKIVDSKCW